MGKIILEFDSNEEKDDARVALDGYRWRGVVWDLDQKLREITKYGYVDKKEATEEERELRCISIPCFIILYSTFHNVTSSDLNFNNFHFKNHLFAKNKS